MTTFTESEQRLDQHIADCDRRMVAAAAARDREDMNRWRDRMYDAINSRTPEHKAKMSARIDRAIDSNWFQSVEALELGKAAP